MRTYRAKRQRTWWLDDWHSVKYMAKQFSGIAFVYAAIVWTWCALIIGANDPAMFERAIDFLKNPFFIFFNCFALACAAVHTAAWFTFLPKIIPPEKVRHISAAIVIGMCYAIAFAVAFYILRKGGVL